MTDIWLGGAENPAHHALFTVEQVAKVAVNIGNLRRNHWTSFSGIKLDPTIAVEWVAWTDSPRTTTLDELLDVSARIGFPPTYVIGGPDDWAGQPNHIALWDGLSTLPVEKLPTGLVITDTVFQIENLRQRVLSGRKRTSVLGVVTGKSRNLGRFDLVINESWWRPAASGETHVWTGTELKRYHARDKQEKRFFHSADIEALGVSPAAVISDDTDAVMSLSVRSWMALAEYLTEQAKAKAALATQPVAATQGNSIAPIAPTAVSLPVTGMPSGRQMLPIVGITDKFQDKDGEWVQGDRKVSSKAESLRVCDNCYLASSCPAHTPGNSCAYAIPVELKTPDQVAALQQAVLEIQTQRFFQARHAEEITGEGLNPQTGREGERLVKMVRHVQEGNNSGAFQLLIKGSGAGTGMAGAAAGGVLSQLFGAEVGQKSREHIGALTTGDIPTDIVDATVVEDTPPQP